MNKSKTISPSLFKLEKPDLKRVDRSKIVTALESNPKKYRELFEKASDPIYIYWDSFKYKIQDDVLNSEELWYLIRYIRDISSTVTPMRADSGEFFKWLRLPSTEERLHTIDMLSGGQLLPHPNLLSPPSQQAFISRGIIEEAIASSQLEGAHTTRAVARKMIIEKRQPRNKSERMILNNYQTINAIEEEFKSKDLSLSLLFEIHRMLTRETIKTSQQNRLRRDEDEIVVEGQIGSEQFVTHVPPKENFLKDQIPRLIDYANDQANQKFTHPIIKAIFLHFWIGYLHPFVDGNGRLARALFYWYLLRKGYWTFMFLPISTVIKRAPVQYALAYVYSEQDRLDATYFYDFHIRKVVQAISDFKSYLEGKVQENKEVDKIIGKHLALNERQKQMIHYFLSDRNSSTTTTAHATVNNVSRQTAAKDLKELEQAKLVSSRREGQFVRYYPSQDLVKFVKG